MRSKENPECKSISIFFGQKHQKTFEEFESLTRILRRSRRGTLHFLLSHYRLHENQEEDAYRPGGIYTDRGRVYAECRYESLSSRSSKHKSTTAPVAPYPSTVSKVTK